MRLPLATLEVFTAIAQHGSLRAAADALGIKPSTVSHQLKSLEDQLGASLFVRTTRSVNLTEAGRALIRGAGPAFDQLSAAVESARTTGHAARGTLKLVMPEFVYNMQLSPVLRSFCEKYPEIDLKLSFTDAFSDILGEEMHAGFRLGDRLAQDMVAIRITEPLHINVLASPDYLQANGVPNDPKQLLQHNCIRYRFQTSGGIAPWMFKGADGEYAVDVLGNLMVNTLPAMVDLASQGLGLIYCFGDYCAKELEEGSLLSVLDGYVPESPGVYIYFPREYRSMMPLRLMIDHLKAHVVFTR